MNPKWKKRLLTFAILLPSVILIVEFEKWMKGRVEPCEDGTCPLPSGHGLFIDPFPDEIAPEEIKHSPASGHPSAGGESNKVRLKIPSPGGAREARGGLSAITTNELNKGIEQ